MEKTILYGVGVLIITLGVLGIFFLGSPAPSSTTGYYCDVVTEEYVLADDMLSSKTYSCSFTKVLTAGFPNNSFANYSGEHLNIESKLELSNGCSQEITLEVSPSKSLNTSEGLFMDENEKLYQCFRRGAI